MGPSEICRVRIDCLLTLQPQSHLFHIVPFVTGTVTFLCIVNVQSLRKLSVIAICTAESTNSIDVVLYGMKLWNIEVFAKAKFNENVLVIMKCVETGLHRIQCIRGVQLKLSVVDEVR